MTIRKRAGRILILGAVAALMAAAGAAPALATDVVFNVSPGGSFGGPLSSPAVTISDTATGTTITCPTSLVKGVITGGTGLSGTHLGRLVFVSFGGCVACTSAKILKGQELRRCFAGWQVSRQDLGEIVRTRKHFQMPPQRGHVARLDGHAWSELILQGEVAAHRVRSLVVELDST